MTDIVPDDNENNCESKQICIFWKLLASIDRSLWLPTISKRYNNCTGLLNTVSREVCTKHAHINPFLLRKTPSIFPV